MGGKRGLQLDSHCLLVTTNNTEADSFLQMIMNVCKCKCWLVNTMAGKIAFRIESVTAATTAAVRPVYGMEVRPNVFESERSGLVARLIKAGLQHPIKVLYY